MRFHDRIGLSLDLKKVRKSQKQSRRSTKAKSLKKLTPAAIRLCPRIPTHPSLGFPSVSSLTRTLISGGIRRACLKCFLLGRELENEVSE